MAFLWFLQISYFWQYHRELGYNLGHRKCIITYCGMWIFEIVDISSGWPFTVILKGPYIPLAITLLFSWPIIIPNALVMWSMEFIMFCSAFSDLASRMMLSAKCSLQMLLPSTDISVMTFSRVSFIIYSRYRLRYVSNRIHPWQTPTIVLNICPMVSLDLHSAFWILMQGFDNTNHVLTDIMITHNLPQFFMPDSVKRFLGV